MLLYLTIFILEVINSCIAALRTILLGHRRKWLAPVADILNETINWIIGYVVFVETKDFRLGIAAAIASGIGTRMAMSIKIPRKKKFVMQDPVNI